MVAYSFRPQFEGDIVTGAKMQTVRGHRRRHARAGEPIQLYTGMRTRVCRKLLTPDPICFDVRSIKIILDPARPEIVASVSIDDVPLAEDEIEAFAAADGFGGWETPARRMMGLFWQQAHPDIDCFEGVVIRWRPA